MTIVPNLPPLSEIINLQGKTALVTGGASGIGLAIVRASQEELTGQGYRACFVVCDISLEDSVTAMVEAAVQKMGRLDILVNNAGIYPQILLQEMTAADFDRVMGVNVRGTFLCSREASRQMIKQQSGCIINIASIDALHPSYKGHSAYDSSKGAVVMFTKSLALELGPYNIRVNAIAPGGIVTGGIFTQFSGSQPNQERKILKDFLSRMALGRMGRPDDVARVALFLASEMASYMTGSLVVVDGGYLIG
jgi:2-deoxy-D-gluconate 3-dehydrogenase